MGSHQNLKTESKDIHHLKQHTKPQKYTIVTQKLK